MKKLLALPIIALLFSACNESPDFTPEFNGAQSIENGTLTEGYTVPVKVGQITVVENLQTGDTIYHGNLPLTIDVPKSLTKNNLIKEYFYVPDDIDIAFGTIMRKGIMLFEDTKTGDNDYNDFVCQVDEVIAVTPAADGKYNINISGSSFTPLALGSYLRLGFGFECRDSQTGEIIFEEELASNIRDSYFDNEQGFINTEIGGITKSTKPIVIPQRAVYEKALANPISFNWFIKTYANENHVNGNKHYTAEASKYIENGVTYNQIITDNNVPYGIFVNGVKTSNFSWALEKTAIWDAYPQFKNWLKGNNVYPFAEKVDANLYK